MSSTNRIHTIHSVQRNGGELVGILEKDWFDGAWCALFWHDFRVARGNHLFHVTTELKWFTQAHAEKMVSAVLAGNMRTIDLRELSMNDLNRKGK